MGLFPVMLVAAVVGAEWDSQSGRAAHGPAPATVCIRVRGEGWTNDCSGTIVEHREGRTLVLTAAHPWRDDPRGEARIEVTVPGPTERRTAGGTLVEMDLDRDVALVTFDSPEPHAVARVAPPSSVVRTGLEAVIACCGAKGPPRTWAARIVGIDRYLGPPNLQTSDPGVVLGCSGGGLYARDGRLIGVLSAVDPVDREVFFTAVSNVHHILDRAGKSYLYQARDGAREQTAPATVACRRQPLVGLLRILVPRPCRTCGVLPMLRRY